jgi:hypothetical protein
MDNESVTLILATAVILWLMYLAKVYYYAGPSEPTPQDESPRDTLVEESKEAGSTSASYVDSPTTEVSGDESS